MPQRFVLPRRLVLLPLLGLLAACADPMEPYIPWFDPALDRTPQKSVTILYRDWDIDRAAALDLIAETCPDDTEIVWIDPGRFRGTVQHPHQLQARCLTQEEYAMASRSPSIRDAVILEWPPQ